MAAVACKRSPNVMRPMRRACWIATKADACTGRERSLVLCCRPPAPGPASMSAGSSPLKLPASPDGNPMEKAPATAASHPDPWLLYIMGGACGASAYHWFTSLTNPRMAALKAGLGVAYLYAGRALVTGQPTLGYDVGTVASAALLAVTYPRAQASGEAAAVAMAALGGVSAAANLIKSYEARATAKTREAQPEREQQRK